MTIRTRLTLWYAGALFGSLLLIAALSYHELVVERLAEKSAVPPEEEAREELGDEFRIVLLVGLPTLLLALGGGWLLTRQALSPITRLSDAAALIHEGNLGQRLPCSGSGDELDRLTGVFNDMTARLDQAGPSGSVAPGGGRSARGFDEPDEDLDVPEFIPPE